MMKWVSAFLVGTIVAEVSWNWYASRALTFDQQLELLALGAVTALCLGLCLLEQENNGND